MHANLDGLLLLPRLHVRDANAIAGPLSWGFPSPTAFCGFAHALQRRLGEQECRFSGVGIICHEAEPQVYRAGYENRFRLRRHPMGKDGKPTGMVEEGRVHLNVSLVIGVEGYLDEYDGSQLAERVQTMLPAMRLAGGSIAPRAAGPRHAVQHIEWPDHEEGAATLFRRLRRDWLPGFALVGRHELLEEHLIELRESRPDADALDALLSLVALHYEPVASSDQDGEQDAEGKSGGVVEWRSFRQKAGWLVPMAAGYGAISRVCAPGEVANVRDDETPFRFVESLYSLGEWRSPHRIQSLSQLLWYYQAQPDAGLYLCQHRQS